MLKNFTLPCLFCFVCLFANAQFEKGQKVLGGSISFYAGKNENLYSISTTTRYANFSVSPAFSWFTSPKQLVGIELSYGKNYNKEFNAQTTTESIRNNNSFSAIFFTERFFSIGKNLFFTIEAEAGASASPGKQTYITNNVKSQSQSMGFGIGAGIAPGLTYRLSPRWLVDAKLNNLVYAGYSHTVTKPSSQAGSKRVEDHVNFSSSLSSSNLGSIGFGFRFLLEK